jgi:hypothetical protein
MPLAMDENLGPRSAPAQCRLINIPDPPMTTPPHSLDPTVLRHVYGEPGASTGASPRRSKPIVSGYEPMPATSWPGSPA